MCYDIHAMYNSTLYILEFICHRGTYSYISPNKREDEDLEI